MSTETKRSARRWGLWIGPPLAILLCVLLRARGVEGAAAVVAGLAVLMGVLWLSEAIPIAATSLLPIALLPLLTGGEIGVRAAAAPYAHELIYLFMGGFMLALAMERWGLHRRIALHIIHTVGTTPATVVLGFMIASAFLSMWISNTATVVMMLPIALSVVELVRGRLEGEGVELPAGEFPFAIALLLGTAYAASLGGTATLIGTPPNLMMAAFVDDQLGREITFGAWLPLGVPFAWALVPVAWLVLTRVAFPIRLRAIPGGRAFIREELDRCGPMTTPERQVMAVFSLAALLWIVRSPLTRLELGGGHPFAGLTDAGIAVGAALLLFALPAIGEGGERLLDWPQAVKLPWGVLLLFGGGLSLAAAMRSTGVDRLVGEQIGRFAGAPWIVVVAIAAGVVILLTEMTSNTATTATFLPILAASAEGLGVDPLRLVIPATLAASCAFMMPVATPPNAIVFGSGELHIRQMCKAGIWMNAIALVWIVVLIEVFGASLPG